MNITIHRTILGVIAGLALSICAQAEPTLAGNKSLAGQTLDPDAVKAVLLGKKVMLGDIRVVIIIAKPNAAQDAFLQANVGMTTSQFQNHWRRLFLTGGGSAPKIVETEDHACKLAADTVGAIAIIDSASVGDLAVLAK